MDERKIQSLYIPLWGTFIFGLFAVLYFAKAIFIPIFLAILTSFLLNPVVAFIDQKLQIPRPIGAGLVLVSLIVVVATAGNYLVDPATMWLKRLPSELKQTETKLANFSKPIENVKENVKETAESLGKIVVDGEPPPETPAVVVRGPNLFYRVLDSTQAFLIGMVSYVILLFLFLAFSKTFTRDAGSLLKNRSYYKALLKIARKAQTRISYYLLVITLINLALGCLVALGTWATGLPNPMVWGASAALLNYIPYVGPAINLGIVSLVSLMTFDTLSQVLLPPIILLGLNLFEGQFVQPLTVGKVFTINPVIVFLSIIIWGWLWGVAGVFMAVPILMVVAITIEQSRKFRQEGVDALEHEKTRATTPVSVSQA